MENASEAGESSDSSESALAERVDSTVSTATPSELADRADRADRPDSADQASESLPPEPAPTLAQEARAEAGAASSEAAIEASNEASEPARTAAESPIASKAEPAPAASREASEPYFPAPASASASAIASDALVASVASVASTESAPFEAEPTQPDATPLGLDVSDQREQAEHAQAEEEPAPTSARESEIEQVFYNSFRPPTMSAPELEEEQQRHSLRYTAEAKARRTHLAKYVKATVGVAGAIVVLAALVRVASPTLHAEPSHGPEIVAASPATEPAKPIAAPATATAVATAASETTTTSATTTAAPSSATSEPAASPSAATSASAAVGSGDPVKEKVAAQTALDKGKLADAIAAGERSVALDPTDGDAWLVLGAAYQEHGDMTNARRCYRSCIDDGKRGAIRECRAMVGR